MEALIAFAVGAFLGWKAQQIITAITIKITLKHLGITEDDVIKAVKKGGIHIDDDHPAADTDAVIVVKIEETSGMYYMFKKDNDQFITQNKDLKELVLEFSKRFPGKVLETDQEWADRLKAAIK